LIDSANSASATSSKCRRGWSGSGEISCTLICLRSLTWLSWWAVGSNDSSSSSVGISESNPRPRPFFALMYFLACSLSLLLSYALYELLCYRFIRAGALAPPVVRPDGKTGTRRFGKTYIPRNRRFKHFPWKVSGDFLAHLSA